MSFFPPMFAAAIPIVCARIAPTSNFTCCPEAIAFPSKAGPLIREWLPRPRRYRVHLRP
jgi:hypothetical protein